MDNCFLNLLGTNSKLDFPSGVVPNIFGNAVNCSGNNQNGGEHVKGRGKARNHEGADIVHGNRAPSRRKAYVMVLDSRKTSHLTPRADVRQSNTSSNMSFTLADNSQMSATHNCVRKVRMQGVDGIRTVRFSDTHIVLGAGVSLMSVPALFNKDIGVLFMPVYGVNLNLL